MDIQRRGLTTTVTLRAKGDKPEVSGYAAMYNRETVIMGLWREQIAPGAFASALNGTDDVRALFNHDPNILLGRTKSGTLRLSQDDDGLMYDIDMPDTQDARDVRELIRRGDVSGSSFGFRIEDEEWDDTPTKKGQLPLVTIRKVELFDVSPVVFPAYPQTSVTARTRALAIAQRSDMGMMDMNMPKVGDRIKVVGAPHVDGHVTGVVRQVIGMALGIEFDGMEGAVHQWYVPSEVMVIPSDMAMSDMEDERAVRACRVAAIAERERLAVRIRVELAKACRV